LIASANRLTEGKLTAHCRPTLTPRWPKSEILGRRLTPAPAALYNSSIAKLLYA